MPTPEQQQLAAMLSGAGEAQQRAVSPGGDVANAMKVQELVERAKSGEPMEMLAQEATAQGIPATLLMQAIQNSTLGQRANPDPTAAAGPMPDRFGR